MLNTLTIICMSITDFLFGWLLYLPRDLTLFIVGTGTALILTLVRLFSTNQEHLKRSDEDKIRLAALIKEAKKKKDKEALARYRSTKQQVEMKIFQAEGKPLLASLIPISLVAIWCFTRIAYLPSDPSKPVAVKAYFPVSSIGSYVHMLPQNGVKPENGWIEKVKEDVDKTTGAVINGVAEWKLLCEKTSKPYSLVLRFNGKTFNKELIVDGLKYAEPVMFYSDGGIDVIESVSKEYKLFGFVPGIWVMQAWIVGYMILVIPFSLLMKKVLKIY